MRAHRLVATLLLLHQRGRLTAGQVATELEVSVATARRDLEALSAAGVPVYPQPGRGGGWALVGGARTDLSGLSAGEAQALFTLVGPAAAVSDDAKAALRKLVQALPATFRADALAAASATTIDPTRWGGTAPVAPAHVEVLRRAVVERRRVRLAYAGSERLVDPWRLVDKGGRWYLLAGTDAGRRTFRLDRVESLAVLAETSAAPDVDLDAAWAEVVEQMEARRSAVEATVLTDDRWVPILRELFGSHCHDDGHAPDGRARLRLTGSIPLDLARPLAGWGALVEVLPGDAGDAVRNELARLGAELVAAYG